MDFKENLKAYLDDEEIEKLLSSLKEENKHAVLLNLEKMPEEMFLNLYPNVVKHPIVPHAYIYNKNEYDLGKTIYHYLGCFYLQEPSAMIVSSLLDYQEGDIVLDLCAAPGGKSMQAAMNLKDKGVVISNDISHQRAGIIVENAERLGLGNIIVSNNDFSKIYNKYSNYFDKIILDAPCSGSGMFRKNELMEQDWTYQKVLSNQAIQLELIDIAYKMLKPGGTMIYSTCSFSYEEDEFVIKHLLDSSDALLIDFEDKNPLFYINKKEPIGIHLFPSMFPGEGHYICLIKKPGSLAKNENDTKLSNLSKNILSNFKYCDFSHKNIVKFGDYLFSTPFEVSTQGLNILRYGLKIGELIKDEIKFDYHFAHYVKSFDKVYNLNDEQLSKYYLGEPISSTDKGTTLIQYNNINVDISKCDGRIIKNRLPKIFRHKI